MPCTLFLRFFFYPIDLILQGANGTLGALPSLDSGTFHILSAFQLLLKLVLFFFHSGELRLKL